MSAGDRRILMLAHTGREEARQVALACLKALIAHGITVRMLRTEIEEFGLDPATDGLEAAPDAEGAAVGCELALVIGGDGTILRAAEVTHGSRTPVLGVNLGHVGFLAEAEVEDVESTIEAIVARRYTA